MKKTFRIVICLICVLLGIAIEITLHYIWKLKFQDMLYITLSMVCVEACVLITLITGIEDAVIKDFNGIHKVAYIRKSVWLKSNIIWMVVNFWMISSSFLSTIIIIYISVEDVDATRIVFYSVMSLFVSIMGYVLNPLAMSRGYRKAYQEIDKAIFEYEKELKNVDLLKEALVCGEEYIEKYSFEMKN